MYDEFRSAEVLGVDEWVPALVVVAIVPDSAVVVVLDEPDFVSGVGTDLRGFAIVTDEGFEFATECVALNPIGHVASERGTGSNGAGGVDVWNVIAEVLKHLYKVGVWGSAPVILDLKERQPEIKTRIDIKVHTLSVKAWL